MAAVDSVVLLADLSLMVAAVKRYSTLVQSMELVAYYSIERAVAIMAVVATDPKLYPKKDETNSNMKLSIKNLNSFVRLFCPNILTRNRRRWHI